MATDKEMKEEVAEMRRKAAEEKAYRKSLTTTEEAPAPRKPASGVDKGEAGKSWFETFMK